MNEHYRDQDQLGKSAAAPRRRMKMKTPGTWKRAHHGHYNQIQIYTTSMHHPIAVVHGENMQDDSRLIAAAPRMLEALHNAADIQHETSRQRGEVDCTDETPCLFCAAIAEAE
jgi:hypothetical protein